jgi:Uma2 family endonuclease
MGAKWLDCRVKIRHFCMTSKRITQLVSKPKNRYLASKSSNMSVQIQRRLFTVSEYNKMAEAGILPERGVELINGEIINMSPIGIRHNAMVSKLTHFLVEQVGQNALVFPQCAFMASEFTQPEPDLALAKFRSDYYVNAMLRSTDLFLLIEVSDTTFNYDNKVKRNLYAAVGVSEYWVVDLDKQKVHTYWDSQEGSYQNSKVYKKGETLCAQELDLTLEMDWLWTW